MTYQNPQIRYTSAPGCKLIACVVGIIVCATLGLAPKKLRMCLSRSLAPLIGFLGLWLWASVASAAVPRLVQVWQAQGLPVPESVLYVDDKEPYLLVSLIDGDSTAVDHKGGIAKLDTQGNIIDSHWIQGLNAPKGMASDGKLLYVADITQLVVIDIKEQQIIKTIAIPGSVFLNDVTLMGRNKVYVSDTRTNRVYLVENNQPSVYLEQVDNANGLKAIGGSLIVGAAKELLIYDSLKRHLTLAKGFAQNIDGVEMISRSEFIVSCWPGLIYQVAADGKVNLLLDVQSEKINTADIGWDKKNKHLLVPNFLKNTVTAYALE